MPPQFTDDEIDRQLEVADASRHLAHCRRPPLGQCTEQEFEEDLYAFLTERGEGELANDLRNKRINWCAPRAACQQRALRRVFLGTAEIQAGRCVQTCTRGM